MARNIFKGLGIALVTPFKEDGNVDYEALKRLLDYQIKNGADFLCILATTGETPTLTADEKKKIKELVIERAGGKLPILMGCGGNNTAAVVEELKTGDFSGIDGVLSVCPFYNKPSQEGLYQHFKVVSEHSPLPIILYNIAGRTGVNMTAETTLRITRDFDNVIGIKEASGDIDQIQEVIDKRPEGFLVLSGDDGIAIDVIRRGGDGVISVAANAFPHCFMEAIGKAREGRFDEADAAFLKLGDAVKALFAEGNPTGVKCALSTMGLIGDTMRLPLVKGTPALRSRFEKLIREYDLR